MGPLWPKKEKTMKNNKIYDLTLTSVFVAIILVMSLIPQIGFITILPGVSVTLVHIPVLIGIFLLPRNNAIILGLFFGIGSWIASFMYGNTILDLAFRNPLISVIPRILFAVAAYYIFQGLKKVETIKKSGTSIIYGIVSLVTVFAIFFGSQAIVTNASYANYNNTLAELAQNETILADEMEDGVALTQQQLDDLAILVDQMDTDMPDVLLSAQETEAKVLSIVTPASLLIIVLFLTTYFHIIKKENKQKILYPSTIILGTLSHTILVLSAIAIVKPVLFGDGAAIFTIIYSIAAVNGLIEALIAVLIGTPVIIALQQLQKNR